jgi:tripartite-type tricarboxylate transporter receptor subunit TctC
MLDPAGSFLRKVLRRVVRIVAPAAFCLVILLLAAPARAQTAEEFYKGKQVTFIIGYNNGGGYDLYGRFAARFLSRHLAGHPAVVPKNMSGAGSITAAKYLYDQAARDGTVIGMIGQSLLLNQAFRYPGADFDMGKFNWLTRLDTNVEMTVSRSASVRTIQDAREKTLVLAAATPRANAAAFPRLLNRVVGTKFNIILGYPGMNDMFLAMDRGEVEAAHSDAAILASTKRELLEQKKIAVLVQYSTVRDPGFPDVPAMVELGRTPEDKQLLALFGGQAEIGRTVLAPPGVPADRVAALRAAFNEMARDPEFLDAARKSNISLEHLAGETVQTMVQELLGVPANIVARAANLWAP